MSIQGLKLFVLIITVLATVNTVMMPADAQENKQIQSETCIDSQYTCYLGIGWRIYEVTFTDGTKDYYYKKSKLSPAKIVITDSSNTYILQKGQDFKLNLKIEGIGTDTRKHRIKFYELDASGTLQYKFMSREFSVSTSSPKTMAFYFGEYSPRTVGAHRYIIKEEVYQSFENRWTQDYFWLNFPWDTSKYTPNKVDLIVTVVEPTSPTPSPAPTPVPATTTGSAKITIITTPYEVTITDNGVNKGKTVGQSSGKGALIYTTTTGNHKIVASKPGYTTLSKETTLINGQEDTLNFDLAAGTSGTQDSTILTPTPTPTQGTGSPPPPTGGTTATFNIYTNPVGVEIFVDGVSQGTTAHIGTDGYISITLPKGSHTITASKEGYGSQTDVYDIKEVEDTIFITLKLRTATGNNTDRNNSIGDIQNSTIENSTIENSTIENSTIAITHKCPAGTGWDVDYNACVGVIKVSSEDTEGDEQTSSDLSDYYPYIGIGVFVLIILGLLFAPKKKTGKRKGR